MSFPRLSLGKSGCMSSSQCVCQNHRSVPSHLLTWARIESLSASVRKNEGSCQISGFLARHHAHKAHRSQERGGSEGAAPRNFYVPQSRGCDWGVTRAAVRTFRLSGVGESIFAWPCHSPCLGSRETPQSRTWSSHSTCGGLNIYVVRLGGCGWL